MDTGNLATIKLISGEELISIVEEGPDPLSITLINRVVVHKNNTPVGPTLSVSHWLMFTKSNSTVIKKSKVVALQYGLEDNTIEHYERFTQNRGELVTLDDQNRLQDIIERSIRKVVAGEGSEEHFEEPELTSNTTIH